MPARFEDVPLPFTSSKPLPTRHHIGSSRLNPSSFSPDPSSGGPARGASVKRSKTLTRPERGIAPAPLVAPPPTTFSDPSSPFPQTPTGPDFSLNWWRIWSYATTWWAPPVVLGWFGIKERQSRQAWREKITLCWIAVMLGGIVGFATMGLQRALCPDGESNNLFERLGSNPATLSVNGYVFNISTSLTQAKVDFYAISKQMPGQDITNLFLRSAADFPQCTGTARYASTPLCNSTATPGVRETGTLQACPLPRLSDATFSALKIQNTSALEGYSWDQVAALPNYLVVDGVVLNMSPYIAANPNAILDDEVDRAIRQVLSNQSTSGKDATRLFYNRRSTQDALPCLTSRYLAGRIDKITPGCFIASLFLYTSLIIILAVVLARFAMACIFNWFMSARLVLPPKNLARQGISPSVMPEGASMSVNNKAGTAPWADKKGANKLGKKGGFPNSSSSTLVNNPSLANEPTMSLARIGPELFAVCLVTCYSEGEDSVRGTVESIAATNYSDHRKLIWIVCDGMITGEGEKQSTPDICVGMLDADPRFGNPSPMGYIAVGGGAKRENRAMIYAGHIVSRNGHRTPTIIVVKCGMPNEVRDKKPGNRGKRDSQLILMNFFSRVTYNDRMSPLDFDIFRKVQVLMGVTPDFFEVVLMVDADTKIYPDSLRMLVNCMQADNMVMGVCGETRIANKRQSWVTAIQVYEYFISHHLAKAFESVFGGVTCLPGCFSMYRIKARKDWDNDWVPILVKPEIVREYSQSEVHTLHQKNLLLLGEDRFLSTILLRTFPHRKNLFLPQARCRTVAPDTFSVLLSQRRRWINSTIHNLMELVRVRNLCGTFCFSMQFVVFMDLVGTVVLPVSICLTGALIVNSIITPPKAFQEAIPLMLLGAVLGLPAILILITTRKVIYVAWMMCYLLALPIWNFVLPVYAFWHFDDFSWGETRRVEGEVRSKAHDDKTAVFDGTTIPLRRWEDWERSRLRKLRREERRRKEMERHLGNVGFYGDDGSGSSDGGHNRSYEGGGGGGGLHPWAARNGSGRGDSDTGSVWSSDEDVWGAEIGGYNENNPAFPPPPIGLPNPGPGGVMGQTLGMDEMAAMLEQGFDEPPPVPQSLSHPGRSYNPSPLHQQRLETVPLNRWDPNSSPTKDGGWGGRSSPNGHGMDYTEIPVPLPNSGNSIASGIEPRTPGGGHAKKRSGGRGVLANGQSANGAGKYGPLGPLDDDDDWGGKAKTEGAGYGNGNGYGTGYTLGYGNGGAGGGGGGPGAKGKRV